MNNFLSSLLLALALFGFGCNSSNPVVSSDGSTIIKAPVKDTIVLDVTGKKYRLVSLERKLSDVISQPELWERIEPLDTNHWYTPTLASRMNPTQTPLFNSLAR